MSAAVQDAFTPLEVLRRYPAHDHTLDGALRSRCAVRGDQPMLLEGGHPLSWTAFAAQADALADALHGRGIGTGDRVAIAARNGSGHVLLLFALARLGAVLVPINPEIGVRELRYALTHADVSAVLTDAALLDTLQQALEPGARSPWLALVQASPGHDLLKDLRKGELDLAIAIALDEPDLRSIVLRTSPIVWLAASTFRHEPRAPLPLIVAEDWTYFRRVAIQALDRAEIPWRIHYSAPNVVGIRAAVRAGLGVMARSIEMLGPDLRVLGNAEKLPQLPDVSFRLYLGPRNVNPLARQIFDSIEQRGS